MSEEPRIQFEESNTVVSEIWFDESSGETVVESQSGEQYRFDDSGTLKAPSLSTEQARITDNSTVTVNVPSDFSTLQEAVDAAISYVPPNEMEVIVNIESEHEIQTGASRADPMGQNGTEPVAVWVENAYASHVRITSDDATVPVESGFDGSVIRNIRSQGLVLDCLIDMANSGSGMAGYSAEMASTGHVHPDAGVINAPDRGLYARQNSTAFAAFGVDFSGAGNRAADINHGSTAYIRDGNFSGSDWGVRTRGPAMVDAENVDCSGCARGMDIRGGYVFAPASNFSGCSDTAVFANDSAVINVNGSDLTNATNHAVNAVGGCQIDLRGGSASGAGDVTIRVRIGGFVSVRNVDCSGSGTSDILVDSGSLVDANGAIGTLSQTANTVESGGIIFQ